MNSAPVPPPRDHQSPRFPVAMKGVVFIAGQVVLLRNEREEWELPGGKLEPGEDPMACLAREIAEELGIEVEIGLILDCWRYAITPQVEVVIVTYGCEPRGDIRLVLSEEHKEVGTFTVAEVETLPMPEGYRRSIRAWATQNPANRRRTPR